MKQTKDIPFVKFITESRNMRLFVRAKHMTLLYSFLYNFYNK